MTKKRLKRKLIRKRLFTKNRLVVLNEDTFEEIFSLRLTLMNVFVVGTSGALLIIFFTTIIIAFTPLREYIPGYSSSKLRRDATELSLKSDSLSKALKRNEAYIKAIKKVMTGELEYAKFNKDSIFSTAAELPNEESMKASEAEIKLRTEVKEGNKK